MTSPAPHILGSLFLLANCLAIARANGPSDGDAEAARQARLDYLRSRAAECELFKATDRGTPLVLTKEAAVRHSDPVAASGFNDGGTFLWLDGQRPLAVATWSLRGAGNVYREFTSLSAEPLACLRRRREIWSPKTGGLVNQVLPQAPAPLAGAAARLGQMRELAGRFSAQVHMPRDEIAVTDLRLADEPIHRFNDETTGVLDGALFSFAEATDPEALLLLEARRGKPDAEHQWHYTLARMTTMRLTVRLDGKDCWSATNFWRYPRWASDPYVESADGRYKE